MLKGTNFNQSVFITTTTNNNNNITHFVHTHSQPSLILPRTTDSMSVTPPDSCEAQQHVVEDSKVLKGTNFITPWYVSSQIHTPTTPS